jgi:DNA repair protein REV1
VVVPYEYDAYHEVSEAVYTILLKHSPLVHPLSCDEAYLDVTGQGDPVEKARCIRNEIFEATGCTASVGIGPSLLIANMATKKAKPNGQFRVEQSVRISSSRGFHFSVADVGLNVVSKTY